MGVQGIDTLATSLSDEAAMADAAKARQRIAESDAKHVANDQEVITTRAEAEQKFAEAREDIDAKYAAKVARAEEQRVEQHAANQKKREDALGRVGLNPDGSNPRDRPQAVVDRDTRKVVDVAV